MYVYKLRKRYELELYGAGGGDGVLYLAEEQSPHHLTFCLNGLILKMSENILRTHGSRLNLRIVWIKTVSNHTTRLDVLCSIHLSGD